MLANLVLHYAFDLFMTREFPSVDFERHADDAVIHCVTERQAREVKAALDARLSSLGLEPVAVTGGETRRLRPPPIEWWSLNAKPGPSETHTSEGKPTATAAHVSTA